MYILALDTATPSCSVAVTDRRTLLAELTLTGKQSHSRHVMEMIRQVLGWSGLDLQAMDGFAVSRGPGSFTGLRIGISTIQGFQSATGKPAAGISCLEALARQAPVGTSSVCSMLDARKGEVYCAYFSCVGGKLEPKGEERVLPPERAIEGIHGPCTFIGSGAELYQKVIGRTLGEAALFAAPQHHVIRASTLAFLAVERLRRPDMDDLSRITPMYIRKSDAERHREYLTLIQQF